MEFSQSQIQEILTDAIESKGLNTLLETMLNCLMKIERKSFLAEQKNPSNKANGYRIGTTIGFQRQLKFSIPRDRLGHFYPVILAIIRNQEEELSKLAFNLYSKGLSTRDVSDVFNDLYGNKYSKSSISRMNQEFLEEAESWRNRVIEDNYPVIQIDALHSKVRRKNTIETEATYIVMGLKDDFTRDIIAIEQIPTESASGWVSLFEKLKKRGLKKVKLVISDSLSGIENAVQKSFKNASLQKCIVHLKRNMLNRVRHSDKKELAEDLSKVFVVGDPSYTKEKALEKFNQTMLKWSGYSSYFKNIQKDINALNYFTYLEFDYRIQNMIYTTNWIENLNKQFRRVLKIRNSMPTEESLLLLITKVAMDRSIKYNKYPIYNFKFDKKLFDEKINR